MLDTNICIYLIKQKPESVLVKFKSLYVDAEVGISSIVFMELQYGVEKSSPRHRAQNQNALDHFLLPLSLFDYPGYAAAYCAKIRADLKANGQTIGPYDSLIASHAIALGAVLVTNYVNEFQRVRGLKIENWI